MSVCFGREILQHQERSPGGGSSGARTRPAANVFFSAKKNSMRLEVALLAMPVLAIVMALTLLPQSDSNVDANPKMTLRVTSVTPPPNAELEREARLRREQIRFALSKVAQPKNADRPAAVAGAGEPAPGLVLADSGAGGSNGVIPAKFGATAKFDVGPAASQTILAAPLDIRPLELKRSAARAASERKAGKQHKRRLAGAQTVRKSIRPRAPGSGTASRQATAGQWLAASLKWPAAAASVTIAPVQRTLTRTVSQAGEVLDSLKKRIL